MELLKRTDCIEFMATKIGQAFLINGYKTNETDMEVMITALMIRIKDKIPNLQDKEFEKAIQEGAYSPDLHGLSAHVIWDWIEGYHKDFGNLYQPKKEPILLEKPDETKSYPQYLDSNFEMWLQGKPWYGNYSRLANWLYKDCRIKLRHDDEIKEKAQLKISRDAKRYKTEKELKFIMEFQLKRKENMIKETMAELAINEFFQQCKNMDKKPSEIINERLESITNTKQNGHL